MNIINDRDFNNEVVSQKGVVVVDFFATWCGPCKMIAPVLEGLSNEMNDVKFVKIDIDNNPVAANTFGIQSIPTLKVFKDGKVVNTIVGFLPKDQLAAQIKNSL